MRSLGGELFFECGHGDPCRGLGLLACVSGVPGAWDVRCGGYLTPAVKRSTRLRAAQTFLHPFTRLPTNNGAHYRYCSLRAVGVTPLWQDSSGGESPMSVAVLDHV